MITDRHTNAAIRRLASAAMANPAIPRRTPRIYGSLAKSVAHDWKVWLRLDGSTWKYTVANRAPDADGNFPTGTFAGQYLRVNGVLDHVDTPAWTAVSATTIAVLFTISTTAYTATIGINPGSTNLDASPATLLIPLALVAGDNTNGYKVVSEHVTGLISFAGCVIPPAITGHTAGNQQFLSHDANSGLKWVSVTACNQ